MTTQPKDDELERELENFQDIALVLKQSSGSVPRLRGGDVHGLSIPFAGACPR